MTTRPRIPAAEQVLELLPDPVMLVQGRGDMAEIAWGNAAARTLVRPDLSGVHLLAVMRQPDVLEAIAEAVQQAPRSIEVAYETIGVRPRQWRAFVQAFSATPGEPDILLMLRDETDARRTERMRADFLANASHELRTPLASLAGFVETLRTHARDDPDARTKFLAIMAEQADRMSRLIDNLLSLSRVELNEHIAPAARVDLAALAARIVEASRPLLAARRVSVEIQGEAQVAIGDEDQLVQVVQNLIDNAVRYSPSPGQVSVRVARAAALPADDGEPGADGRVQLALLSPDAAPTNGWVRLDVADQGRGIARSHLPRLSERFYRVEGQGGGGAGLGLAIVKHVINRHRGGLTVLSAEGRGACFSVYLPAASP